MNWPTLTETDAVQIVDSVCIAAARSTIYSAASRNLALKRLDEIIRQHPGDDPEDVATRAFIKAAQDLIRSV